MTWIERIAQGIGKVLESVRASLPSIPPFLLMYEGFRRPGLSAISSTANMIRRMPEATIETGTNPDGSPNKNNQFIRIICEEVVKEIKDNAKITCVLAPQTMNSVGEGANEGGPVVVTSNNPMPVNTNGITQ